MLPPVLSKADLHLLYVFSTVVESGGFSAAQVHLNVAQSTISRQILDLEARLGMKLCQRGRKGFRLTDKGEIAYSAIMTLFSSLNKFNETIDGTRGKLVGSLSLAVVDNWVFNERAPIVRALTEFVKIAPDVDLELRSIAPDDIEIAVQDGHASLGIGVFHKQKPGLTYEVLVEEKIGLYCSDRNPLASITDKTEAARLLKDSYFSKRAYLNEDIVSPITQEMPSNARAHQIEGIAMLILTGKYAGYLPESFANLWIRDKRMVSVCKGCFDLKSDIKLVQKRGEKLNLVERTMAELIKNAALTNS